MRLKNLCGLVLGVSFGAAVTSTGAHAGYYVWPIIDDGSGPVGNIEIDGPTSKTLEGPYVQSSVNLADGSISGFTTAAGAGSNMAVYGGFGDRITLSSNAIGTQAKVTFTGTVNFNLFPYVGGGSTLPSLYLQSAYFIYEGGSGVDHTTVSTAEFAPWVVASGMYTTDTSIPVNGLSGDFNINFSFVFDIDQLEYDLFAWLDLRLSTGDKPTVMVANFLDSLVLNLEFEEGVTFTSESGVFPGSTPASGEVPVDVPLPASWLLIAPGLAFCMRRRWRR